jgi:hypothetical protein
MSTVPKSKGYIKDGFAYMEISGSAALIDRQVPDYDAGGWERVIDMAIPGGGRYIVMRLEVEAAKAFAEARRLARNKEIQRHVQPN